MKCVMVIISQIKSTSNLIKNHMLRSHTKSVPWYYHYSPIIRLLGTKSSLYDYYEQEERDKLQLHKSKGQHLLTNPRVLDAIVTKSAVSPTDTVLEIGPGTGNLTLRLLHVASKVIAVEIDKCMVDLLHKRVAQHGLQHKLAVIPDDALKAELPRFDLVVANIPYGISSPIVTKLVYGPCSFRSATLLLQKEFARRLMANPGDSEFNRLAVNVKLLADVEFVMNVSRRDFVPYPKVDSSVVLIRRKPHIPDVDLEEWWAFTRTCFGNKNRTLGAIFKQKKKVVQLLRFSKKMCSNSLEDSVNNSTHDCADDNYDDNNKEANEEEDYNHSSSRLEKESSLFKKKIVEVLKDSGFGDKRPSRLSNEELLKLLSLLNQAGIYFRDQTKPRNADTVAFAAAHQS